jgi:iron(III) transport system permease protein
LSTPATTIPSAATTAQRKLRGSRIWDGVIWLLAGLVLLPVAALVLLALSPATSPLARLTEAGTLAAVSDTVMLGSGVVLLSLVIGVSTGWIIANFDFTGRRALSWALVLPFAVPTYIAAYTYVDALDFFGPVQAFLRALTGWTSRTQYWFPDLRSMPGAITVLGLVLYPYVYVASRAAFAMQGASLNDAARSLGCSRLEALRRVVLPVIWPAIAAATTLVILETLNDIGASQYLGIQTMTVRVFSTWLNRGSVGGAAQLALLLAGAVLAILWLERAARRSDRYGLAARGQRHVMRTRLTGIRAFAAAACCLLPVLLGFALPAGVLLRETILQMQLGTLPREVTGAAINTILVSAAATLVILAFGVLLALAARFSARRSAGAGLRAASVGYALPGTVLVIGLLPVLGSIDGTLNALWMGAGGNRFGLLLSGTAAAVVLAYVIRFLSIGIDQTQAGLGAISRNVDFAALLLGYREAQMGMHVLTPCLRPVLLGAGIIIFVDCLKELPATLLLRPLDFETLATLLYGHAARGSFEDGAAAALMIVAAGLLPLWLMNRYVERD